MQRDRQEIMFQIIFYFLYITDKITQPADSMRFECVQPCALAIRLPYYIYVSNMTSQVLKSNDFVSGLLFVRCIVYCAMS